MNSVQKRIKTNLLFRQECSSFDRQILRLQRGTDLADVDVQPGRFLSNGRLQFGDFFRSPVTVSLVAGQMGTQRLLVAIEGSGKLFGSAGSAFVIAFAVLRRRGHGLDQVELLDVFILFTVFTLVVEPVFSVVGQ